MPNVDRHAPGTACWFDLMTPDPEKARAFYGQLLGWDYEISGPETGHYSTAKLKDRVVAGMGQMPEGAPFPTAWSVYLAVESVNAALEAVKGAGGMALVGPMEIPAQGQMAICADPTGAAFGLWEPINHRGATIVDEPGAMTWQEVNTRDAAKARDFYTQVFGLTANKMEGMEYWTLHKGEKTAGGVLQMDANWPADLPPHWMAYFAVEDTDASVEKLKSLGGNLLHGPFDTPYGRIAVVSDPFGAAFSIIKLSSMAASMG